ncbi:hypothetical protein BKA93DRAFT_361301 [Sparassis latifolia]
MSELFSSELACPEVEWSELPFSELTGYAFADPELNPMSCFLTPVPKFASPISAQSNQHYFQLDHLAWWEAAIWECIPYMNIPRLPPELTDRIINFVGSDPRFYITEKSTVTVYSCALVCRTWLPASVYRLYSQDYLKIDIGLFEALVRASRASKPAWVYQFPLVLGRMFSALQELCIQGLEWGKVVIHPRTLLISFGQFGRVTKMQLRNCTFRNFCQFRHLICALPRLRTLNVLYSRLERCETSPITHAASPFPTFTCLVVKTGDDETQLALSSALFGWLTLTPASIHRLQRLDTFLYDQILSPLRNLLMHAGTSLEDLDLDFGAATASNVQHLDILGHCTVLHNLTLQWVLGISLAEILRIISPNCRLQKLDISMQPREVDCKWESAARIVDELQFLTLREFKLGVNGKDFAEEEKRHILGCFDALRRRGVDFRLFFDGDLYQ